MQKQTDNAQLIARVKAGDRDAFNELYGLYWALLVNYAGLFVDESQAEDIVQDVFVRVWSSRENIHDTESLCSYLLRSVHNAAMNRIRREGYATEFRSAEMRRIEESCYDYYDPDNSEIIRQLYYKEVAGDIDSAIESLSPKCREVFRLSHIDGLSNKEISSRLDISVSTVENHINRTLKQLRFKLGHYKMFILLLFYLFSR